MPEPKQPATPTLSTDDQDSPLSPEIELFGKLAESKQPKTLAELRAVLDQAEKEAANAQLDPTKNELVRIYNRATKIYSHGQYVAGAQSFCTVPRWLAEKWISMFKDDILPGTDALKAIDSSAAAVLEANAKRETAEKLLINAQSEIADLKAQLGLGPKKGPSGN